MTPFDKLIHRVVTAWEAHRRQKRLARLLTVNPQLKAAAEAHARHQKQHRPTKEDWAAMRDAMTAEPRREVHG